METQEAVIETTADAAHSELTARDRCDRGRCNAQARCRVIFKDGGYLDFCYHDYNELEEALESVAAYVIDEREKIE